MSIRPNGVDALATITAGARPDRGLLAEAQRRSPRRRTPELSARRRPAHHHAAAFALTADRDVTSRFMTGAIRRRWRAVRIRAACSTTQRRAPSSRAGALGRYGANWTIDATAPARPGPPVLVQRADHGAGSVANKLSRWSRVATTELSYARGSLRLTPLHASTNGRK